MKVVLLSTATTFTFQNTSTANRKSSYTCGYVNSVANQKHTLVEPHKNATTAPADTGDEKWDDETWEKSALSMHA